MADGAEQDTVRNIEPLLRMRAARHQVMHFATIRQQFETPHDLTQTDPALRPVTLPDRESECECLLSEACPFDVLVLHAARRFWTGLPRLASDGAQG